MDDKRLARIEDKLDDTAQRLTNIDVTLAAQHVSIKEHIRRTNILEAEMKPIKTHVDMVKGGLKLIAIAAMVAGIIEVISRFR